MTQAVEINTPNPSRRGALFYGSAVLAGYALHRAILPGAHDPIVELLARYDAGRAEYEITPTKGLGIDAETALSNRLFGDIFTEICEQTPPITTHAGAAAAIRFLQGENLNYLSSEAAEPVLEALLAFIEGNN